MKLFTARLSEAQRSKLETIRASMGLRSDADAVRRLIEDWRAKPMPIQPAEMREAVRPVLAPIPKAQPKPFKSRLKGEWKAP